MCIYGGALNSDLEAREGGFQERQFDRCGMLEVVRKSSLCARILGGGIGIWLAISRHE